MKKINRARPYRCEFYISDSEKEIIDKKFEATNIKYKSDFYRTAILKSKIFVVDMQPLIDLNIQISKIGNNINQIARIANTEKSIDKDSIKYVQRSLDKIWQLQKTIMSKAK